MPFSGQYWEHEAEHLRKQVPGFFVAQIWEHSR